MSEVKPATDDQITDWGDAAECRRGRLVLDGEETLALIARIRQEQAEVERLRAGLDELTDGQCGSAYGNGCDGGCQSFAGRVLRGEWQPLAPAEVQP